MPVELAIKLLGSAGLGLDQVRAAFLRLTGNNASQVNLSHLYMPARAKDYTFLAFFTSSAIGASHRIFCLLLG